MQMQVQADSDEVVEQVTQLLRFYLAGLEGDVDRIDIVVDSTLDRLGVRLYVCRVGIRSGHVWRLDLEEVQADLALAVTRALDRSVRALRRRLTLRCYTRCA